MNPHSLLKEEGLIPPGNHCIPIEPIKPAITATPIANAAHETILKLSTLFLNFE